MEVKTTTAKLTVADATQTVLGTGIRPQSAFNMFAACAACPPSPLSEPTPLADLIEGVTDPVERARIIRAQEQRSGQ